MTHCGIMSHEEWALGAVHTEMTILAIGSNFYSKNNQYSIVFTVGSKTAASIN